MTSESRCPHITTFDRLLLAEFLSVYPGVKLQAALITAGHAPVGVDRPLGASELGLANLKARQMMCAVSTSESTLTCYILLLAYHYHDQTILHIAGLCCANSAGCDAMRCDCGGCQRNMHPRGRKGAAFEQGISGSLLETGQGQIHHSPRRLTRYKELGLLGYIIAL